MSELPVLIAGAGISGLLLAQHLQQQGVPFRLFEQDAAIDTRSGGWGLTLHWGLPALRELLPDHLVARLPETYVNKVAAARGDTGRFQFFDLQTGSALYSVPAAERIRVSRVRLRQLLATGLDIQWNKTLQSIDSESAPDRVTARCEDGTAFTGCLLVGCDGSRSRAREMLYPHGPKMRPLPVQLLGGAALYSPEEMAGAEAIDPFLFQGSHPETDVFFFFSLLDTPNNFDDSSKDKYLCQIIISWADAKGIAVPGDNAARLALIKSLTANWVEPFRGLVHNLPDTTEARSIRISDWMFRPAQNHAHPRVVLVGDSAHTMTMYRGEGANNAIVDVLDLTKRVDLRSLGSLTPEALREALAAYETDVFTRADPSVRNSRQACLDAHDFSRIVNGSPLVSARLRE
ncbi:FAD binding domain protein [Aspergillus heteromorphus CBS 117.55]|uniref:FAD binding domain protein n=1 Tax=Aspergillus heteromorphus CBS 117.55 TaxID=1448321 RepID=A0A317WEB3_9EURO|nr:FAD binding domain protein [Aspergillus heteromorphus CBS 117.55]PWY84764.1 FAD binding domain protein [Aspergillus heteromorphus CBS 117.55]